MSAMNLKPDRSLPGASAVRDATNSATTAADKINDFHYDTSSRRYASIAPIAATDHAREFHQAPPGFRRVARRFRDFGAQEIDAATTFARMAPRARVATQVSK